jgi:uncharacterized membrane protein
LAAVGAVLGYWLGSRSSALWDLGLGAAVGFVIGELRQLRFDMEWLESEITTLQDRVAGRITRPERPVQAPAAPPAEDPASPRPEAPRTVATPTASPPTAPAPAPARPRPAPGRDSERPSSSESPLFTAIRGFFTGGNTLVRAGVVVLFFGVAFLLRYAAEHSHVPIELRLSAVALGGVALLVLGWRLRKQREGYALALQGGAVGILYLTVFAALRLYSVLPPAGAFLLLVVIALLSAALAVLQNSQAFAMLGVSGGFLAPVLASTGEGSHVVLFSYYLVLNAGIVVIAWFRSWRPLNLCGFLFTFAIGTAWGVLKYRSDQFSSTEPFLVAFFLLYLGMAVLFARRQPLELRGYVDGTLVFGTPIAAFGLQTALLRHDSPALAYSALSMSAMYLVLTFALRRRRDPTQYLLTEAFLALGVVFVTLAIPLALGNRMNSAAWALEGAGLIWIGCRQERRTARALGTLLQLAAAVLLLREVSAPGDYWLLPLGTYPGVVLLSVACLFSTAALGRARASLNEIEALYAPLLFGVGLFLWCFGTVGELPHAVTEEYLLSASLGFLALTALILSELARRVALPYAAGSTLLLLPAMLLVAAIGGLAGNHPFAWAGWAAWPLSFAVFYGVASRHEGAGPSALGTLLHTFSWWLLCALLGWEMAWQVSQAVGVGSSDWSEVSRAVLPALGLLILPVLVTRVSWPFAAHRHAYVARAGLGLALVLALWILVVNAQRAGNSQPLPFVPLLNPLDVVQMLVLLALFRFARLLREVAPQALTGLPRGFIASTLALLTFVWCNGMLLRTLHHWTGVPFTLAALAASNVVETALSIFWSVLALITMLAASRRRSRTAWLAGAGLLVIVVGKLFFVDLSSIGSIPRIISFLGVGLLMLVIGYFSPLPPRAADMN